MYKFPNQESQGLWALSKLIVWHSVYWMVTFDMAARKDVLKLLANERARHHYSSYICDNHEISIIASDELWSVAKNHLTFRKAHGPLACITFDIPLNIEVSGFLQPAVTRLAESNISVVPQCALVYDHIFVHAKDRETAVGLLRQLQQAAQVKGVA